MTHETIIPTKLAIKSLLFLLALYVIGPKRMDKWKAGGKK